MRRWTRAFTWVLWVVAVLGVGVVFSSDIPKWWLLVGFFALAIPWGIYSVLWGRRHRRVLAAWAAEHGWTALPNGDPTLVGVSTLPPFGQGINCQELDVVQAPGGGWPVFSYTYRWSTPGQSREARRAGHVDLNGKYVHVVAAMLPARYPYLEVMAGKGRGGEKVPGAQPFATGNPAFDQRFHVVTTDPAFAAHVLASGVTDALLAEPPQCRSWRIEGPAVLWWRPGFTKVEAIEPAARLVSMVAVAAAGVPRGAF